MNSTMDINMRTESDLYTTLETTAAHEEVLPTLSSNLRKALKQNEIAYILIGIFGILGNGISIIVFIRSKKLLKSIANHFLVNQSINDLVAAFFLLTTTLVGKRSENLKGVAGALTCFYWNTSFPMWSTFLSSTYNLVALSVERYLEICQPILHKRFFSKSKAYAMMACAWAIGFIFHIPRYPATSAVIDGKCYAMIIWSSVLAKQIYAVITFFLQFILPIIIHVFCYVSMIRVLKNPNAPGNQNSQHKIKARRNIFKTLLIVVVLFILCWTWNQTIFFFSNLGLYKIDFSGWNYHLSVIAIFLNCCVNPVIYVIKYQEFKNSLRRLVCKNDVDPEATVLSRTQNSAAENKPSTKMTEQNSNTA